MRGRPFKPGQSGNPTGRPKGAVSIKTRVVNAILKTFDFKKTPERIKQLQYGDRRCFKEYLDLIITLLPRPREITDEQGQFLPLIKITKIENHPKPEPKQIIDIEVAEKRLPEVMEEGK